MIGFRPGTGVWIDGDQRICRSTHVFGHRDRCGFLGFGARGEQKQTQKNNIKRGSCLEDLPQVVFTHGLFIWFKFNLSVLNIE
jgi:hypothetical protein